MGRQPVHHHGGNTRPAARRGMPRAEGGRGPPQTHPHAPKPGLQREKGNSGGMVCPSLGDHLD
eukprot:5538707-Alexandrium_andersonii.AAC.1